MTVIVNIRVAAAVSAAADDIIDAFNEWTAEDGIAELFPTTQSPVSGGQEQDITITREEVPDAVDTPE